MQKSCSSNMFPLHDLHSSCILHLVKRWQYMSNPQPIQVTSTSITNLLACDSRNSSSISLSPITWEQCTIHDQESARDSGDRKKHNDLYWLQLFHIGEKSGLHKAVTITKKTLQTKHWHTTTHPGLQERRLSFKRFTELFDLQSSSVCHLVTSKLYEATHLGSSDPSDRVRFTICTSGLWIHEFARTAPQTKEASQIRSRLLCHHEHVNFIRVTSFWDRTQRICNLKLKDNWAILRLGTK